MTLEDLVESRPWPFAQKTDARPVLTMTRPQSPEEIAARPTYETRPATQQELKAARTKHAEVAPKDEA